MNADNPPTDNGIHPPPSEFTAEQLKTDEIIRFFHYRHLPPVLQASSYPFFNLAMHMITTLPRSAERTAGLRKLLEAKDCAVRAALPPL
jgi:hypothetical protein